MESWPGGRGRVRSSAASLCGARSRAARRRAPCIRATSGATSRRSPRHLPPVLPLRLPLRLPPDLLPGLESAAYDFGVGTPDPALFPFTTWRRLVAHEFRGPVAQYAKYGDPGGHAPLRAAIARHTGVSRAGRADADDVIVTQGAQQAFDLIGRVLISEGTPVAVEDPGYPDA